MNTEQGTATLEALFVIVILILISAMAVETRLILHKAQKAQALARNGAVQAATYDSERLRCQVFEAACELHPCRCLRPLLAKADFEAVQSTYIVFAGTQTHH